MCKTSSTNVFVSMYILYCFFFLRTIRWYLKSLNFLCTLWCDLWVNINYFLLPHTDEIHQGTVNEEVCLNIFVRMISGKIVASWSVFGLGVGSPLSCQRPLAQHEVGSAPTNRVHNEDKCYGNGWIEILECQNMVSSLQSKRGTAIPSEFRVSVNLHFSTHLWSQMLDGDCKNVAEDAYGTKSFFRHVAALPEHNIGEESRTSTLSIDASCNWD